jgi:hypothetical protein
MHSGVGVARQAAQAMSSMQAVSAGQQLCRVQAPQGGSAAFALHTEDPNAPVAAPAEPVAPGVPVAAPALPAPEAPVAAPEAPITPMPASEDPAPAVPLVVPEFPPLLPRSVPPSRGPPVVLTEHPAIAIATATKDTLWAANTLFTEDLLRRLVRPRVA